MSSLLAAGHYFGICILRPDSARPCIGDFNPELINAYQVVKERPDELIEQLACFRNEEAFYYEVKFMLSNSSAALVYDLYENYHIDKVSAGRAINAGGSGRGQVTELIIRNYH